MWSIVLLPILLLQGAFAHDFLHTSDAHQDEKVPVAMVTTLLDRIDQMEKKLEECDRHHARTISALRTDYQKELATVRRQVDMQATRISLLEVTARRQQKKINVLLKSRTVSKANLPESNIASNQIRNDAKQEIQADREVSQDSSAAHAKERIRRAENEVDVAFFTTLSTSSLHLGANQNVVFDTVITNIANAYNPHFGSFVAPVAGTYVFSMTLMTEARQISHYGLYHNNTLLVRVFANGAENVYDSDSQTAVLYLKQGDDVGIRHIDTDRGLHGDRFCSFAGFLLSQDFTSTSSPSIVGK